MKQKWLPEIAMDLCTGREDRVVACGSASLAIIEEVIALIDPGTCGSEQPCIEPCTHHANYMTWQNADGDACAGNGALSKSVAASAGTSTFEEKMYVETR